MEETRVTLKAGPDAYIEGLALQASAKSLSQDHRLLHVFYDEIQSGSPNELVGNGWTAEMIELVHEAVVRRTKLLDPTYKHDSPLQKELQATVKKGIVPLMIVPDYVSVVGGRAEGREGDLDVVVREDKVPESVAVRLQQAFGEEIHLIEDPQGPHDENSQTVYHLVLLPDRLWQRIQTDEKPMGAAMDEFSASLGSVARNPLYRTAIVRAAAYIRRETRGKMPLTAREIGREYAARIIAGENIPCFSDEVLLGSAIDWDKVRDELVDVFIFFMNACNEANFTAHDLFMLTSRKQEINRERQRTGY